MAIVLICLYVVLVGLDVYSSWSLKKAMKKFHNSQKKLF